MQASKLAVSCTVKPLIKPGLGATLDRVPGVVTLITLAGELDKSVADRRGRVFLPGLTYWLGFFLPASQESP